jgi:uncharacterized membrane protein YdjX (TVP38/TMEM64 family)
MDGNPMSDEELSAKGDSKSGALKRFLPLFILVAFMALVISQGWHQYLTLEVIAKNRDWLKVMVANRLLIALSAYFLIYVAAISMSLPGGVILTITGGFLFGPILGGGITVVAATVGASLLFLIAKTSFGETLAQKAGPWLSKLSGGFQENALSYLLFLRLVPAFPFWLVNLAPALLGVSLKIFIIGTFVGIIPGTFAFAYVGAGLDSIIDAAQADLQKCLDQAGNAAEQSCTLSINASSLITQELLIAFAALGFVALIPVALKKLKTRKG